VLRAAGAARQQQAPCAAARWRKRLALLLALSHAPVLQQARGMACLMKTRRLNAPGISGS